MEPGNEYINILLLGESGSGKSTFINSLANYLQYPSLEDAMRKTPECLISTSFTMTDENFDDKEVSIKTHPSLLYSPGVANGDMKDYIFHWKEKKWRVIDTPAVGDAKGIDQDKKNVAQIVAALPNYSHLNAIVFLVKSNVTIINEYFAFSIRYLLSRVEKTMFGNIVFVFTHSRGTFFKPGETLTNLKTVIDDMEVDIRCDKMNIFCVDNEAFRYLVASYNGMRFTKDELKTFSESWKRSRNNCLELLDYVSRLKPHCILHEQSSTEAINEINILGPLLYYIAITLETNIRILTHIRKFPSNYRTLQKIPMMTIKSTGEKKAMICTGMTCSRTMVLDLKFVTDRTICHQPCSCPVNQKLKNCKVFKSSSNCFNCSCGPQAHKQKSLRVINDEMIFNQTDRDLVLTQFISLLEHERQLVLKTLALFHRYRKENSKNINCDPFKDILEKEKNRDYSCNELMYKNLKQDYDNCLKTMTKADVSVINIETSIREVYNTERTGNILKSFHERRTENNSIIRQEKTTPATKTHFESATKTNFKSATKTHFESATKKDFQSEARVDCTFSSSPLPNTSSKIFNTRQPSLKEESHNDITYILDKSSFNESYDNVLMQLDGKIKSHRLIAEIHGEMADRHEKLHSVLLTMKQSLSDHKRNSFTEEYGLQK